MRFLPSLNATTRSGRFQVSFADTERHHFLLKCAQLYKQDFTQPVPLHAVSQAGASLQSVFTGDKTKAGPVCSKPPRKAGAGSGLAFLYLMSRVVLRKGMAHPLSHSPSSSGIAAGHCCAFPLPLPVVPIEAHLSQAPGQKSWPGYGKEFPLPSPPPVSTPQKGSVHFNSRKLTMSEPGMFLKAKTFLQIYSASM